jgi:hypothetical protein
MSMLHLSHREVQQCLYKQRKLLLQNLEVRVEEVNRRLRGFAFFICMWWTFYHNKYTLELTLCGVPNSKEANMHGLIITAGGFVIDRLR